MAASESEGDASLYAQEQHCVSSLLIPAYKKQTFDGASTLQGALD